jgi:hypothetical protein
MIVNKKAGTAVQAFLMLYSEVWLFHAFGIFDELRQACICKRMLE